MTLNDDVPSCCKENGLQAKGLGNDAWPVIRIDDGVRSCVGGHKFETEQEWIDSMQGVANRIGICLLDGYYIVNGKERENETAYSSEEEEETTDDADFYGTPSTNTDDEDEEDDGSEE